MKMFLTGLMLIVFAICSYFLIIFGGLYLGTALAFTGMFGSSGGLELAMIGVWLLGMLLMSFIVPFFLSGVVVKLIQIWNLTEMRRLYIGIILWAGPVGWYILSLIF
jgi:hypothetical protein